MTTLHAPKLADWNVVVTLPEQTFREARRMLGRWGSLERTSFYNVLVMRVADPKAFLADFAMAVAETPGLLNLVSHVVPAQRAFFRNKRGVRTRSAHDRARLAARSGRSELLRPTASPRVQGDHFLPAGRTFP